MNAPSNSSPATFMEGKNMKDVLMQYEEPTTTACQYGANIRDLSCKDTKSIATTSYQYIISIYQQVQKLLKKINETYINVFKELLHKTYHEG